ncbi:MAG: metallophosphoesterase [Clostridia bacterium]|nr:metallophosphoesterase [Clostridia bacterium]
MTYVMSDLHGQYEKYRKMLELIRFSDEDELYVLGDVLDRGPHPIRLLRDMSLRHNVFPLMGNHEHMAETLLRRLCVEITEQNAETQVTADVLRGMLLWQQNGSESTLREFRALSADERFEILSYLEEFSLCEELTVGDNRFVLVHASLPDFSPERSPYDYEDVRMLYERADYDREYYPDRYLITGHTPTLIIDPACRGRILRRGRHIAIDCGAGHGLPLGCLRLDDLREFYVD